jgi:hypothetical protein
MIASENSRSSENSPNMQQAPKFNANIVYSKWERDFKAFIRRIPDCDFVLKNMTKPVEPTLQTDESRDNFKKKHLKWEKCLEVWERGNSTMFSHIYSAVCEFTRAYNVASAHEMGVDALNALKKEFENTNAVKEQAEDLRAEFDNKKNRKKRICNNVDFHFGEL